MNKKLTAVAVAALASVTLLTGFWGGGGRDDEKGRSAKVQRMATAKVDNTLDDVDATDAQREKIHAIKDRLIGEGTPLFTSGKDTKKVLFEQWQAEKPAGQKVHSIVDERFDSFRAFAHKVVDGALEIHSVLNAEQRKSLSERFVRH